MGSRYKTLDMKMREGIPGPGQYNPKPKTTVPSVKFGSSNRASIEMLTHVPGPGEYVGNFENVAKTAPKFG